MNVQNTLPTSFRVRLSGVMFLRVSKSLGRKVTLKDVLGPDALQLMKDGSFAIFVLGSLLISIPPVFSEIGFTLVMRLFFVRLGMSWTAIWLYPGATAFVVILLFAFFFKDPTRTASARPS